MSIFSTTISAQDVQALPVRTQLQLVRDAAREQAVSALVILEEAGLFNLPTAAEVKDALESGPEVKHAVFAPMELPFIAAIAELADEAPSVFNDQYIESGAGFESSSAYKVRLLEKKPGMVEWFDGFVERFLERASKMKREVEGLGQEFDQYTDYRFRHTSAVLLATAAALGTRASAERLLDALNDPSDQRSVFTQHVNADALLISSKFLDGEIVNTNLAIHPVLVAFSFHEPEVFELFVEKGWSPADPVLCYTEQRNSGRTRTHFIPSADDKRQSVFNMMTHSNTSDGIEVQPEMMARILDCVSNVGTGPVEKLCLRKWAEGLIQGDEPELEMIKLAEKHRLYGIAPEVSIQVAVARGSERVLDLVLPHLAWSQCLTRDFQPFDCLFDSDALRRSSGRMASFADHLTLRIVEYGEQHRLLASLPGEDGEVSVAEMLAQCGCVGGVLRCLEAGVDPDAATSRASSLSEHAKKSGHNDVADVILSFQARKVAETALNECVVHTARP